MVVLGKKLSRTNEKCYRFENDNLMVPSSKNMPQEEEFVLYSVFKRRSKAVV